MAKRQRTSKKRVALLPQLRERFVVFGDDMAAACDNVGVSRNTGSAWRKIDEAERGKSWDDERAEAAACSEFDLLKLLNLRVRLLIENQAERLDDRYFDQQVETAMRNRDNLAERIGGPVAVARTLEFLTPAATQVLNDDELAVWERVVNKFDRAVRDGSLSVQSMI